MLSIAFYGIGTGGRPAPRGTLGWDGHTWTGTLGGKRRRALLALPARSTTGEEVQADDDPEGFLRALPDTYRGTYLWAELDQPGRIDLATRPHDAADPEADALLTQAQGIFAGLAVRARRDLADALRGSANAEDAVRRVLAVVEKHLPTLARTLALTRLAALLTGMRRVAGRLPSPSASQEVNQSNRQEAETPLTNRPGDLPTDRLPELLPPEASKLPLAVLPTPWGEAVLSEPAPTALARDEPPLLRLPVIEEAARSLMARGLLSEDEHQQLGEVAEAEGLRAAAELGDTTRQKLREKLAEAVTKGLSMPEFAERVEEDVAPGTFASAGALENYYRSGMQSAYAAGLEKVRNHPLVSDAFPYVETLPIRDSRLTPLCAVCSYSGLDGTGIYRADDPTWQKYKNPRHWQ